MLDGFKILETLYFLSKAMVVVLIYRPHRVETVDCRDVEFTTPLNGISLRGYNSDKGHTIGISSYESAIHSVSLPRLVLTLRRYPYQ